MKKAYLYNKESQLNAIPDNYIECAIDFSMVDKIPDSSCLDMFVSATVFNEEELLKILKKIRHSGKITITGPDLYELARNMLVAYLSEKDVRTMISTNEKLYSCIEMSFILERLQFKVLQKRVNHNRFFIVAERM